MSIRYHIKGEPTKEYRAYYNMLHRVFPGDEATQEYVRGTSYENIEIDQVFLGSGGFETFLSEIGKAPDPTFVVDRINNEKGYIRGNIRWSSRRTSSLNRRMANMITAFGKTQNLADWARETGLHHMTIYRRIDLLGWSIEDALTLPRYSRYKRR